MVGPRKWGPLESTAGQEGVSLSSRVRVVEEGAAPRQGVEASGLGTSIVKMDKEMWFSSHTTVTSRERPRSRETRAWDVGTRQYVPPLKSH